MTLARKLTSALLVIGAAFGLMDVFFRFLVPTYFAIGWEDSIFAVASLVIGSILLLAGVVVVHVIWRDHQR